MTTDLALKLTRRIAAPPDRLFDAWLDPAMLAQFMRTCEGDTVSKAETDPRVGGRYDIVMKTATAEIPHWGIYKQIERPHRLVFTWESPHSLPGSLVTLTFAKDGDATLVTLEHDRFKSDSARDGHEKGWGAILDAFVTTMTAP